jgi:hypothetical protein
MRGRKVKVREIAMNDRGAFEYLAHRYVVLDMQRAEEVIPILKAILPLKKQPW